MSREDGFTRLQGWAAFESSADHGMFQSLVLFPFAVLEVLHCYTTYGLALHLPQDLADTVDQDLLPPSDEHSALGWLASGSLVLLCSVLKAWFE